MEIAKLKVTGVRCTPQKLGIITRGMVGAEISLEYADPLWDGLTKTVVFRGAVAKDVINAGETVTVPPEVLAVSSRVLSVGVYGVDADGTLVIPTLWADLGKVKPSADPSGDTSTNPSLPVWAQIQAMIGNLDDLDTDMKISLVAAVNEAMKKGGAVDEAEIRRIVDEYLTANPPTVTETDPTVPAWAKQPQKPAYTASEVGAISQEDLQEATNEALAQAKASGEFNGQDGKDGADGQDGITPTIGENGNWYLGNTDTGKPSRGEPGQSGADGQPGSDGAPGPVGATPNIQIGTVETLAAGSPATASMTGTAENPLLNLGIPKGADGSGEGGSGIAVTGATVGQTVKIAAVDDDGVPTAWEPTDFPSGGGGYELVGHVQLEENVFSIDIDLRKPCTDLVIVAYNIIKGPNNNNPHFVKVDADGTETGISAKYNVYPSGNGSAIWFPAITNVPDEGKNIISLGFYHYQKEIGVFSGFSSAHNAKGGYSANVGMTGVFNTVGDYIETLKFGCSNSSERIAKGVQIFILGC